MILSGKKIESELNKSIFITDFDKKRLNSNSYNLKLNNNLMVYTDNILDLKKENNIDYIKINRDGFILQPGKLYLGRTLEYTKTFNYIPMLEGRSSIGRLGITIHITAGFGDVGFCGYWTLEISCVQPVKIYPFIEICQIYYHTVYGDYENYKSNKYQNNKDIQPSLMFKDFE